MKASLPVVVAAALAGALAPVVAPVVLAALGLPFLAALGEARSTPSWRARLALPMRFLMFFHSSLGHVARLFVPLAIAGVVLSQVPTVHPDVVARVMGSVAGSTVVLFAIAHPVSSADPLAIPLRAGRDAAWRALVGESGRLGRPVYALCAASVGATLALATSEALWWPLHVG